MVFAMRRLLAAALATLACLAPLAAQSPNTQIKTDVFLFTLDPNGHLLGWEVADPAGEKLGTGAMHALLDPEVAAAVRPGMFDVLVDGEDLGPYRSERQQGPSADILTYTSAANAAGLQVVKTFEIAPAGHLFGFRVEVRNTGSAAASPKVEIVLGPGVGWSPRRRPELADEARIEDVMPFFAHSGSVWGADIPREEPWQTTYPPEGETAVALDWAGLHSQYFTVALQPEPLDPGHFDGATLRQPRAAVLTEAEASEHYPILLLARALSLAPGASDSALYTVYGGLKSPEQLADTGRGLEPITFHFLWDWLAAICLGLREVLAWLVGIVGSWGLAIIVFAVLFRLLVLPLSLYGAKQQLLMKDKMAELKPKIQELKAQYKGEQQDQAIMKLYKEHGVNPFSQLKGCLPLAIQLPVLVALFNLLQWNPELRAESFLWIEDLTVPDRLFPLGFSIPWLGSFFNLLPVIMFVAQLLVGLTMAKGAKDGQAPSPVAMLGMPIAMLLLFYPFPSGAMLFWTTGTILQVLEQKLVTR